MFIVVCGNEKFEKPNFSTNENSLDVIGNIHTMAGSCAIKISCVEWLYTNVEIYLQFLYKRI